VVERVSRKISAFAPLVLLAIALVASPTQAISAQDQEDRGRAEDMAREGMERIMRALELFMDSIPQYELPEVNEHGDIIIKRKRDFEDRKPKELEKEPDATDT
jgi:hypothetical protein